MIVEVRSKSGGVALRRECLDAGEADRCLARLTAGLPVGQFVVRIVPSEKTEQATAPFDLPPQPALFAKP
jgi:hypothetical protein